MKIARYLFGYLFKCTFDCLYLSDAIINQQMLELLFDENKTNNLPLQIHSRRTILNIIRGDMEQFLNFIYNYLIADEVSIDIGRNAEPKINILFRFITTTQDKFGCVSVTRLSLLHQNLYELIIQHIETSKDILKMAKKIELNHVYTPVELSERAENIKIYFYPSSTTYELSNIHNPKIKFSIRIGSGTDGDWVEIKNVAIKRIN
uniref:Uncharacterized protein n=1 Tax=Meloidogyne enterolobii TaxID=390850 RepID=A0A6V7VUX0_MELEN|nr:unnamed protein product [Meloidogyne enterolobii]